jgi:hypothetical protein
LSARWSSRFSLRLFEKVERINVVMLPAIAPMIALVISVDTNDPPKSEISKTLHSYINFTVINKNLQYYHAKVDRNTICLFAHLGLFFV